MQGVGVDTVYPKKYAHGFVVLCFIVVMQSFIMNSHEVSIHIHQGCFAGTGEIVRLPQCQWSMPDGYGKISQCITTTKHSKAKTVCIFLGIYCSSGLNNWLKLNFFKYKSYIKKSCEIVHWLLLLSLSLLLFSTSIPFSSRMHRNREWRKLIKISKLCVFQRNTLWVCLAFIRKITHKIIKYLIRYGCWDM